MSRVDALSKYSKEVQLFRLGGVFFYQTVLTGPLLAIFNASISRGPRNRSNFVVLLSSFALLLVQLSPAAARALTQITVEPQPVFLEKHLPKNTPVLLLLAFRGLGRVLGRASRWKFLWRAMILVAAHTQAGSSFMSLLMLSWGEPSSRGTFLFGAILGLSYSLWLLGRGGDVLQFPILQKRRLLRIKQRLLPSVRVSLIWPFVSLSIYVLLSIFGLVSLEALRTVSVIKLLIAAAFCAFCFNLGREISQIVMSERLTFCGLGKAPVTSDTNALLFEALRQTEDEGLQSLALLELCHISETQGRSAERRKIIFGDESGASWQLLAQACLQEIEVVTLAAADALPQSAPQQSATSSAPKWNQRPAGTKQALVMPDRKQNVAAWVIRSRLQNVNNAVNALTGFATASLSEDRYGILQLTDPTLGTVVQAILSLQLVLERHLRSTASTGSRRFGQSPEKEGSDQTALCAHALSDTSVTAIGRLADCFGQDLLSALLGTSSLPHFGSISELSTLLQPYILTN